MPKFALKSNMSALVRQDVFEGRDYLVAPVVLITEGVHNDLFYSGDELAKFPDAWNGETVPVYHPLDLDGRNISVNDPKVIEEYGIGRLFKVHWDAETKKLKGEVWIDIVKANSHEGGKKVLAKLEADEMIEVSTGLFVELVNTPGVWNDEEYKAVAINIRPDHLALLPDKIGACSIRDGAGLPRVNEDKKRKGLLTRIADLLFNRDANLDVMRDNIRRAVQDKFNGQANWVFLEAMFEKSVVIGLEQEEGKLKFLRLSYSVDSEGKVTLSQDEPVEVRPELTYNPVTNENKEKTMDREKAIKTLIERKLFVEAEREFLEAASDDRLQSLLDYKVPEAPAANAQKPKEEPKPEPSQGPKVLNMEQFMSILPPEVRETLQANVGQIMSRKDKMIKVLVGNARCQFSEDQLRAMDTGMLENLATLAQVEVNFDGNDPGQSPQVNDEDVIDEMPEWDWNKGEIKAS